MYLHQLYFNKTILVITYLNCNFKTFQEFSAFVRSKSRMFYDIDSMMCRTPQKLKGTRIDKVTQAELQSVCSSGKEKPSYNETALIISMSALGALIVMTTIMALYVKFKKSNNALVGSNETIITESSQ